MTVATHTALVTVYMGGELVKRGSTLNYTGDPNWKFEPIDPRRRAKWEAETADSARVADNRERSGDYPCDDPPSDLLPVYDPRTGTSNFAIVPAGGDL